MMTPEQFDAFMQVVRYGFLAIVMIGFALVFEPSWRDFGTIGKLFAVAMQTTSLVIAAKALVKVLQ